LPHLDSAACMVVHRETEQSKMSQTPVWTLFVVATNVMTANAHPIIAREPAEQRTIQ
jgi:hypothetical protein